MANLESVQMALQLTYRLSRYLMTFEVWVSESTSVMVGCMEMRNEKIGDFGRC